MKNIFITKTNFINFILCHKMLWLDKYKRALRAKPTEAEELNLEEGNIIGEMATKHQSFKGGKLIKTLNREEALEETKVLLENNTNNLYEPAFLFTNENKLNFFLRVDILSKNEDGSFDLVEVKSSSSYQEIHLWDIAFQLYVLEKSGIKIKDVKLVKPTNGYIKEKEINLNTFFDIEEVSELVRKKYLPQVEKKIEKIAKTVTNEREPSKVIGSHCKNPWNCPFSSHCKKNINNDSVEKLSRLSKYKRKFFRKEKIKYLSDINNHMERLIKNYSNGKKRNLLSPKQKIQVEVAMSQEPFIDKDGLKMFLSQLVYPLYHLDFEAYNKTIPPYEGMKPHQFLTFQASIHKEYKRGSLDHKEFLQENKDIDPREKMIHFLLNNLGKKGSIIVYNKSFEKTRIKELAKDFPKYEKELSRLNDRMMDLEVPFKKHYYHHDFEGSSSIKKVLPVIVPELSYDRLLIQNGSDAQAIYRKLLNKKYHVKGKDGKLYKGKTFKKMKQGLLSYCSLDTFAMVKLLRALKEIVKDKECVKQEI